MPPEAMKVELSNRKTLFEKVIEFHEAGGLPVSHTPDLFATPRTGSKQILLDIAGVLRDFLKFTDDVNQPVIGLLRVRMALEEMAEYLEAEAHESLLEVADALVDKVYIDLGSAATYGIPFDAVFDRVHEANLAKFANGRAEVDTHGKIIKPDGWQPPDLKSILQGVAKDG